MELLYTIVGADGQQYGPHPHATIQTWANEGRVTRETAMLRSDETAWRTGGDFSELQWAEAAAPAPPEPATAVSAAPASAADSEADIDPALLARVKSGAGWFYLIAALSSINCIAAFAGSNWRFIIGTGLTEIFNAIGSQMGDAGKFVALALDALLLGAFVLLGYFAGKRHRWAFILGMLVYAGDALIYLLVKDWIAIGFHVFAIYCMFAGFQAARAIRAAR